MISRCWLLAGLLTLAVCGAPARTYAAQTKLGPVSFALQPASPAIAACLPGVQATATVVPNAQNDTLTIHAAGLLSFAAFDLYLTTHPREPYGVSWPLSMLQADAQGVADALVQTSLLQAAVVNGSPTAPTHLVLFFDNPRDADACFGSAGAPATPYNSAHQAGPAALATIGYPDSAGPLQPPALARPGLGFNVPTAGYSVPGQAVTFTSTCSHPNGWTAIRFIDFRLTQAGNLRFWARLDRPAKRLYLYDPITRHWTGGQKVGSKAILLTPLTQLIVTDSKVVGSAGATGKVIWTLSFAPAARGQSFQQSVQVTDLRYQSSGWNPTGSWNVD